ncbi:hypothetical protein AUR65_006990 [Haloferax marisrubri]|uniref:Uncharacterized protein n=1 Tax=Haloferax marisrubri TaxID=1544719 RepID=A0A2P4NSZ6_9EURY|nr:hypothetical protein AUR65_006990 [Haloferax marisrubri]
MLDAARRPVRRRETALPAATNRVGECVGTSILRSADCTVRVFVSRQQHVCKPEFQVFETVNAGV